jgi:Domain of unknown function (DUF4832)/Beta-galactosidase
MKQFFAYRPNISRLNIPVLIFALTILACNKDPNSKPSVLQEDQGFLQIPGVGWQTFYCTADEDQSLKAYKFKSGCAYYRWYWATLEPQEGQYNFALIDDLLKRCRDNNQALAFRVMCEDPSGEGLPQWLIDKGIKRTYSPCPQEGAHYAPDMSDPIFKYYHERLIRALGERYDGHPDLALLDIGSVGLWGEWHIYCDPSLMPDSAICHSIVDLYYEAFPNTPLTALMACIFDDSYAVHKGNCGWRADSWGDADGSGGRWNHHEYYYWPTNNKYPQLWKTGTVAFEPGEPGGTMSGWTAPVKKIVDDAIAWHSTFVQNKSQVIPSYFMPDMERLVMKLGFRLVLRNISFQNPVPAGSEIPIKMKWENLGIAPPYRDHRIAFRLLDTNNVIHGIAITDQSVKGWLPGEKEVTVNYKLPDDIPGGDYSLEMGIVFHNSIEHNIPIANKGKTADGWYTIGSMNINP